MPRTKMEVTVYDGKYHVVVPDDGGMYANRYGEPWRDLCGDGMVLALVQHIGDLSQGDFFRELAAKLPIRTMAAEIAELNRLAALSDCFREYE